MLENVFSTAGGGEIVNQILRFPIRMLKDLPSGIPGASTFSDSSAFVTNPLPQKQPLIFSSAPKDKVAAPHGAVGDGGSPASRLSVPLE